MLWRLKNAPQSIPPISGFYTFLQMRFNVAIIRDISTSVKPHFATLKLFVDMLHFMRYSKPDKGSDILKERLKKLRKALDLTQQEFADRIGIGRGSIATYETRDGNPGSSVINLICREFNVSETWLRTGEGEMFTPSPTTELDALASKYPNMTHETYVVGEKLVNLPKSSQNIITGFLREVVKGFGDVFSGTNAKRPQEMSREEIHAELDLQLDAEKEATENASAFGHGSSGTAIG